MLASSQIKGLLKNACLLKFPSPFAVQRTRKVRLTARRYRGPCIRASRIL